MRRWPLMPLLNVMARQRHAVSARWLDNIIKRIGVLTLKLANPMTNFGDGHGFQNLHDRLAHFLHDAADAALGFVGTRTTLVKSLAHAAHWRQGAFHVPDHRRQRDVLRRPAEPITAGDP